MKGLVKAIFIFTLTGILILTFEVCAFAYGKQRMGGNGAYHSHEWTCRGVSGYLKTSNVTYGRVQSYYVNNFDCHPRYGNLVEIGWRWIRGYTNRELFVWVTVNGVDYPYSIKNLGLDESHQFLARYMYDDNTQERLYCWAFFMDGKCYTVIHNLLINEGWAYGGSERHESDWPTNQEGGYWMMGVWAYYPQGYWAWIPWTQPYDWTIQRRDELLQYGISMWVDDNYCFYAEGSMPTDDMRCKRIN